MVQAGNWAYNHRWFVILVLFVIIPLASGFFYLLIQAEAPPPLPETIGELEPKLARWNHQTAGSEGSWEKGRIAVKMRPEGGQSATELIDEMMLGLGRYPPTEEFQVSVNADGSRTASFAQRDFIFSEAESGEVEVRWLRKE